MPDARRVAVGVCIALPFLLGAAAGTDSAEQPAFRFTDPDIVESSGLVVLPATRTGALVVTANDSGDTGRVFTVDVSSGSTVGVTSWTPEPVDVEALAPDGPGHVWVGDIGDNRHVRDSVEVLRAPVGPEDVAAVPEVYELVYPDGPRDAEALVRHPLTGQLFVITKGVFAGTVYAAPLRLRGDRPNRLREVGAAPGIVTYNLGTGRGNSVLEMVTAFEEACGRKIAYQIVDRRPGDVAKCYADPTRAREELGWTAERDVAQMCADVWRYQTTAK